MDWKDNCIAVIPCFNETACIRKVVTQVQKHLPGVLVVDDGSTDTTTPAAKSAGAEVLQLPANSGKGAALRRGWEHAHKHGFQWVLMLDGDGQHDADEIPKFFDCAKQSRARLIVGNRMKNSAAMPFIRRYVNHWMSRKISQLTGADLPDSQCGFRLAHLETLLHLPLLANRFEIESAMLVAFLAAKQKVEFVAIRAIYENQASSINPLTDSFRWLRWRLAQRPSLRGQAVIQPATPGL